MSATAMKTNKKSNATLIDTTKCIGCRSCMVTCKSWNNLEGTKTEITSLGLQNPPTLSADTQCVVTFSEIENANAPGGLNYVFTKRQCMHCDEPACASACPVTAFKKEESGAVTYDSGKCLGCRYCMWACPFGVPTADWDSLAPEIHKCDMCHERCNEPAPTERNGVPLTPEEQERFTLQHSTPACVKQCPAGALQFGDREELLQQARARIQQSPGKYVDHIYGEKEAGGTAMLYMAAVPFKELGLPEVGTESYPARSAVALGAVPPAVIGVGAALGGVYALQKRKSAVKEKEHHHHVEFAPIQKKFWTPANVMLAAVMAFGGLSFILRFALGLGGATNLSDTWAWGLWIVFDLVWIAVAAGAFATAGLIYVFQRKDLYGMGRSAVLMGLLSYSFVTVTLLADLGLPWHFWQLGVQAPEHSAMFEVSWCVGLYVTVLLFEFLPVPFERLGMKSAMESWKKWSPWYVVGAVMLFVYLMSRSLLFAGGAAAVFSILAVAFKTKPGEKPIPIMLAIAAVTLSTMHQSSLGSLFLLMPDKLDAGWWSPVMPIAFFLSAVAAGTALIIIVEMWIAKAWSRSLRMNELSAMGKIAFFSLLAYQVFHLGDLVLRGQLGVTLAGPKSGLFLVEIALGGIVPLVLLSTQALRAKRQVLAVGALLSVGGVVLNRVSTVALAMNLTGPLPQLAPQSYTPSAVEWGVSLGLIAATIFLFGLAVRHLPVLPKEESSLN